MVFGKNKERKMLVITVDITGLRTIEDQDAYMDDVKKQTVRMLKDINREDDFDVIVIPNAVNVQIAG